MSRPRCSSDGCAATWLRAGEASGVLETVLETIATYKENIEGIKGKIKKRCPTPPP